jgi:hypothetical protein
MYLNEKQLNLSFLLTQFLEEKIMFYPLIFLTELVCVPQFDKPCSSTNTRYAH